MTFADVFFWVLAVVGVGAALGVVLTRDVFRAALLLVVVFLSVAGFFVLLNAEFLAVVQVLIYAGAIAILIIFAVMLTRDVTQGNLPNNLQLPALLLPALVLAALVYVAIDTDWRVLADDQALQKKAELVQANTIAGIPEEEGARLGISEEARARSGLGDLLINDFVVPFEVASVLLLAAVIGALALVRERQA